MTSLRAAVVAARARLRAAGIDQAEIEAEVLLRYALEVVSASGQAVSRADLFKRFEDQLPLETAGQFESLLARRLAHEPSAYITGRKEFWGLEFLVTPAVLIPRPETEGLVEAVLRELAVHPGRQAGASGQARVASDAMEQIRPSTGSGRTDLGHTRPAGRLRIADVGTGSGAIAVALAKELPQAEVYATDASRQALSVALENARRHGVERRIALRCGSLLEPVHDYVDCVVANLPYVTTADWQRLEPELREHEPRLALDGGADGLDLIRALLRQAPRYLRPDGFIALEIGEEQAAALGRFVDSSIPGAERRVEQDLAGKDRVFVVRPLV